MLKRLYEIIEKSDGHDKVSSAYDYFMVVTIIVSIVPLCFANQTRALIILDRVTACIFIVDYLLRLFTTDANKPERKLVHFLRYPFTPMAIIDVLSILPSFTGLNHAFRVLKVFRLIKTLRIFKFARYSSNMQIILNVFRSKSQALLTVGLLAFGYIFVSALIVFQVEPDTFGNFFKAFYWATVSLTTVGYGDIYPMSDIGRFISMLSSFFGIAIIALPSGIIISGYQEELNKSKSN